MRVPLEGRWVPIFPVGQDKRPLCHRGFYGAKTDFTPWPTGALPAVPTGAISGLDVLDVDPQGLTWLNEQALPPTRVHSTPRGGFHYLFRAAPSLRSSVAKIAAGVDVRAGGGFIVWWPAAGLPVQTGELTEWPEWLLALAFKEREVVTLPSATAASPAVENVTTFLLRAPTSFEKNWSERAAQNAFDRVSNAPRGTRNHKLNGEAYALGRLVARGWISQLRVERILGIAARRCGLGADESRRTIASGLRAGRLVPYSDISAPTERMKADD